MVLTGDRVRSLFATSETRVSDGIAGLPLPEPSPSGGPAQPSGQGVWSGDGAFTLAPSSTPQTRPFTLTNVGSGPLTGGPPEISGDGAHAFQILSSNCPPSLPAGDATVALAGSAAGCVAGNQVFTASGTFTCPPFFQGCTVRILVVGGGGGGQGGRGIAGGGGGSGRVARCVGPSSNLLVGPIAVTVGIGGAGGIILEDLVSGPAKSSWDGPWNGQHGDDSAFGSFLTAKGGAGGLGGVCWWSHPLCQWSSTLPGPPIYGTGGGASDRPDGYALAGSAGGCARHAGASNGGNTSSCPHTGPSYAMPGANGQGPFLLSGFSQRSIAAGNGGPPALQRTPSQITTTTAVAAAVSPSAEPLRPKALKPVPAILPQTQAPGKETPLY